MEYLFGDSGIAAQRLEVLAEVFSEPTKAFLLETVAETPRLALDLGCGPGCTTRFLAELLRCERVVGIDSSEHFIDLAKRTETEAVSFCLHDVTSVPFPEGPADLIYCRFLLSHLPDPQELVGEWATQLRPGGLLLVEEVDRIHTRNSVFRFYLDIVEDMMDSQAARLYVGPVMDRLRNAGSLKRRASIMRPHQVPTPNAATMFYMNIQTWKHQPFIRDNYSDATIERLESDLQRLASKSGGEIEIEWGLRQIVFERI